MRKITAIAFISVLFATNVAAGEKPAALAVYQRVGLASDGYQVDMKAKAGFLVTSRGVLTVSPRAANLNASVVGSMPYIPYGSPRTQSQWIYTANYWFPYQYENFLKPNLLTFMQGKKVSTAIFDYGQRVLVQASPQPKIKWLSWRVVVDSSGRARYADAKLLDESPQPLYVLYTPKKLAEGLPSSLSYTDAGTIKWHIMDANGNQISAVTTVDVNGAYDQPEVDASAPDPLPAGCFRNPDNEAECKPDFGLKCLIDKNSDASCPAGYVDVKSLIDLTAPSWVVVDYARHVQPVFEEVTLNDGSVIERLKTAVNVTRREWQTGRTYFFISPGGGTRFNVEGNYGYEIRRSTERYRVDPGNLSYTMTGLEEQVSSAPTANFSKSVPVTGGARCPSYTYNIIDPFDTNQVYDWRNDTVNYLPPAKYLSVAPLTCY